MNATISKDQAMENLKRFARLRDEALEELDRAFPSGPNPSQGYRDRAKLYDEYQGRCDEMARIIYAALSEDD